MWKKIKSKKNKVFIRDKYKNVPEMKFKEMAEECGFDVVRRGYPDFMIIFKNKILGFVEVKPRESKKLRLHQSMFEQFCKEYGIPFYKWYPGADMPRFW